MNRLVLTISIVVTFLIIMGTIVMASTGIVKSDGLNVRDNASTNANSIGTLNKNQKINIIGEENNWYKIDFEGNEGYVSGNYVDVGNETEQTSGTQDNQVNDNKNEDIKNDSTDSEIKKTLNETDLYILPLVNTTKIKKIPAETEIRIISNNGKWLYIQVENDRGWIISNKIDSIEEQKEEVKEDEDTNKEETIEENKTEEKNTVEENKVETESKQDESTGDSQKYPITMYVMGDSVNIRSSASTTASVISGTTKNSSVKVIAKEGEWYKVDTEDGVGYIKSDLLSTTKGN